jgi:hypothetical protein
MVGGGGEEEEEEEEEARQRTSLSLWEGEGGTFKRNDKEGGRELGPV